MLVRRLIGGDQPAFTALRKNIEPLKKVIKWAKKEDSEYYKILDAILKYSERYGQLPATKAAVRDFAKTSDDHDLAIGWTDVLTAALKELNDIDEARLKAISDPNVLIDNVVSEAEKQRLLAASQAFDLILTAGPTKDEDEGRKRKKKDPSGIKDAKAYLLKILMDDVYSGNEIASGWMHENIDLIAHSLDDKLAPESTTTRMKTLMPHVDKSLIIGPQHLRFIGIAGMSGDGKTTILNTLVYNWLRQGYNGLYISFEHTPLEIWEFMAFLHSSHEDYGDIQLPSLNDWDLAKDEDSGIVITQENIDHMGTILTDMKTRTNLPGRLEVRDGSALSTFEAIAAHLETFDEEGQYDFIVVDYLTRMNVGGDARYRDLEIKEIIHKTQRLTRNFRNGRGIVFVTPMQINREANKAAKKVSSNNEAKDGLGESTFYDLNAIAHFSEFQHDMDYIFAVYSDEKMKSDNHMMMETLKHRRGKRPPIALMELLPGSGRLVEKTGEGGNAAQAERLLMDEGYTLKDAPSGGPTMDDVIDPELEET